MTGTTAVPVTVNASPNTIRWRRRIHNFLPRLTGRKPEE
jgi:hypothetical protein